MSTPDTDPVADSPPQSRAATNGWPPDQERGEAHPPPRKARSVLPRWLDWRLGGVLLLALVSIPIWRLLTSHARAHIPQTEASTAQAVAVARVSRQDLFNEIPIPAEFRPYLKVELHAKVSGYVEQINVDIGDRVKAGQLLAKLEVPELKDELNRALAAQQRAQADYKDAHLVYTRLLAVEKEHPNLIAQQELDAAEAKDATTEAAIAGAKAEVERCQTLLAYTRITAPFDGVITHRYADPGSLIQSGTTSDTQSMPLVCLSDNYRLRLDFPVSVAYVKDIHTGDHVEVRVDSFGGKTFTGTITRTTLRVNEDTRTMTTEIEVPNPDLELVPGMYAEVVLKVQAHPHVLAIPIEAVPPGQTSSVYVINDRNQIEERPVKLGIDTPTECEVKAGLKEGELVLIGSRSQVHPGQKVEAKLIGAMARQ
jgi:RND family efflux transporter MFP subunit